MIRVIYRGNESGELSCSLCGQTVELIPNAHTWKDANGTWRTHPDARLAVRNHFHFDENAYMEACTGRLPVGATPWEAIDGPSGEVVARGDVFSYPEVRQEDPPA